jgi:hypothetical protein
MFLTSHEHNISVSMVVFGCNILGLWSMLHRIVMNVTRIVKYVTSNCDECYTDCEVCYIELWWMLISPFFWHFLKDYTKGSKITNPRSIYHPERRGKNGVQNRRWKNVKPVWRIKNCYLTGVATAPPRTV